MKEKEDQPTSVTKGLGITTSRISARVQYVLSFVSKDQDINEGQDTHTHILFHSFIFFLTSQNNTTLFLFCVLLLPSRHIHNQQKKGLTEMAALPFSTTCRHSNSPLHPNSKSSLTGFSQRNNILQLFFSTKSNSRWAIRRLCVKNVASDKKEELKEQLTEQGC